MAGIASEQTIVGHWWLPEAPQNRVPGTLLWSSRSGLLSLQGHFGTMASLLTAGAARYAVVHGLTSDGRRITVINALTSHRGFHTSNGTATATVKLHTTQFLLGTHFVPDQKFSSIEGIVPGLDLWLRPDIVEKSFGDSISYSFPPHHETSYTVHDGTVHLGFRRSFDHEKPEELTVRRRGYVRVQGDGPQSLSWLLERLVKVCCFLAFTGATAFGPDRIVLRTEREGTIEYFVQIVEPKLCGIRERSGFFLTESLIGDFAGPIAKWLLDFDSFRMPIALAHSVFLSSESALHVQFLSWMQVFEGFHRLKYDGFYIDRKRYDEEVGPALISQVLGGAGFGLSGAHRDSLKSRLKFGNEKSLRNRMKELANSVPTAMAKILLGKEGDVPKSWIATRNYYTHWDETQRAGVVEGEAMLYANTRMRSFARCLFLLHVGISPDVVLQGLEGDSNDSAMLRDLNRLKAAGVAVGQEQAFG